MLYLKAKLEARFVVSADSEVPVRNGVRLWPMQANASDAQALDRRRSASRRRLPDQSPRDVSFSLAATCCFASRRKQPRHTSTAHSECVPRAASISFVERTSHASEREILDHMALAQRRVCNSLSLDA